MRSPRAAPKDGRYVAKNPNRLQHYYQFRR